MQRIAKQLSLCSSVRSAAKCFSTSWRMFTLLLFSVLAVQTSAAEDAYKTNFDKSASALRTDRYIRTIDFNGGGGTQTININRAQPYIDLTADKTSEIWCRPGESVAVQMNIQGTWMHGYVYIDLGNDGQFSYNEGSLSQSGTDVMSFSFYSGDFNKSDSGVNSAGMTLTGSAVNTMELPGFVAPTTEGTYRIRFKMDWNSVDPAGQVGADGTAGGANGILANGGSIVDATLVVSSSAPYNNIAELDNNKSYYIECPLFYNTQGVRKAMYVGEDGDLLWNTLDESNPAFQWIPTVNEDGTVVFKNAYSNTYLAKYTSSVGSISIADLSINKNGTAKAFVNLSNPNDVVNNLEFTFYLPDGIELESAKVAGRANGSHSISYTVFLNGGVRVTLSPIANGNIARSSSGEVVELTFKTTSEIAKGSYTADVKYQQIYNDEMVDISTGDTSFVITVSDLNSITEWSEFSNDKIYTLRTLRAFLLYSESYPNQICGNTGTSVARVTYNAADPNQQFQIINNNGTYYLYSVGAQKYVGANGQYDATATTPLNIQKLENNELYPWKLCIGGQGMNTQKEQQVSTGILVNSWTVTDEGNCFAIEEVDVTAMRANNVKSSRGSISESLVTTRNPVNTRLIALGDNQFHIKVGSVMIHAAMHNDGNGTGGSIVDWRNENQLNTASCWTFSEVAEIDTTSYQLTFMVDSVVYEVVNLQAGAAISLPAVPTKTGHTFVGWQGLPDVMPAKDITVTATFRVDEYYILRGSLRGHSDHFDAGAITIDRVVPYGTDLTTLKVNFVPDSAAVFNGWTEIPTTMPAHGLQIEGDYDLREYTIRFMIDDLVSHEVPALCGAKLTFDPLSHQIEVSTHLSTIVSLTIGDEVESDTIIQEFRMKQELLDIYKEGHTFTHWSDLPATMPAQDLTVKSFWEVNKYEVTYKVDGEVFHTDSVKYESAIVPPAAPTKPGYTFTGWQGLPDVMPAHDVEVEAMFEALQNQVDNQGVEYELNDDGTLTIKGTADGTVRDVVIPSELNGTPVTHIAEGAFKNSDIKSIVIPESVVSVGKGAFEGCTDLVWVDWKSQADADADCFDTPEQHGNLVVFTPQEGDYAGNVVVNGVAETITLVDARPYEAPYDYVAKSITFTKRFAKTTAVGLSGGWEGMVVPFDVEYIQHGERSIAPFGGTRSDDALGCWVAELNDKGEFEMVSTIRADRPVIIAMPNSEEYDDDYNISGDVVFSATDAQIKATPRPDLSPSQTFVLRGTYEAIEEQSKVYTLNDEVYTVLYVGDCMPGSVFVANERDVRPFEAYVFTSNPQRSATLKIGGVRPTGIETLLDIQYAPDAWYTLQGVRLNKKPVQTGFYIHGGKLEFVRQR